MVLVPFEAVVECLAVVVSVMISPWVGASRVEAPKRVFTGET
jgi:hypothetical protein